MNFYTQSNWTIKKICPPAFILYCLSTALHAEPLPDAGSVNKQLSPLTPQTEPQNKGKVEVQPTAPALTQDAGTTFDIQSIKITGNQAFTETELQPLLTDLIGSKRTITQAREAAERITRHYREAGFMIARAYPPQQKLNQGVLTIAVLEGVLSTVKTENTSRLPDELVHDYLDNIPTQTAAQETPINRAVLLLGDVPGVANVEGRLTPGEKTGETALVLAVKPQPLFSGRLDFDNYGSLYTGRYRFGGMVDANNPFGYGERFSARILGSDEGGLVYGRFAAQLPIGSDGLTLGTAVNHNIYSLGNSFAALDAVGSATTAELNLKYPWLRSVNSNIYTQASFEHRERRDEVRSTATKTDKTMEVGALSLQADLRDNLLGAGLTQGGLSVTSGYLNIDTPSAAALDKVSAKSAGNYAKFGWNFSRQQALIGDFSLGVQFSGQWTYKNLDSWEKFSLGGPGGVRGYAVSEAMGDIGWLTRLELHYALIPQLSASVFHDRGWVMVNAKPYLNSDNYLHRSGTGLGLDGGYGDFDIHGSVAWRGSQGTAEPDKSPRFWIQTGWRF